MRFEGPDNSHMGKQHGSHGLRRHRSTSARQARPFLTIAFQRGKRPDVAGGVAQGPCGRSFRKRDRLRKPTIRRTWTELPSWTSKRAPRKGTRPNSQMHDVFQRAGSAGISTHNWSEILVSKPAHCIVQGGLVPESLKTGEAICRPISFETRRRPKSPCRHTMRHSANGVKIVETQFEIQRQQIQARVEFEFQPPHSSRPERGRCIRRAARQRTAARLSIDRRPRDRSAV